MVVVGRIPQVSYANDGCVRTSSGSVCCILEHVSVCSFSSPYPSVTGSCYGLLFVGTHMGDLSYRYWSKSSKCFDETTRRVPCSSTSIINSESTTQILTYFIYFYMYVIFSLLYNGSLVFLIRWLVRQTLSFGKEQHDACLENVCLWLSLTAKYLLGFLFNSKFCCGCILDL